jgi:VWFA-related protein
MIPREIIRRMLNLRRIAIGLCGVVAFGFGVAELSGQSALPNASAPLAIEVHVVSQAGDPVTGLRPDQFQVMIGGREHAVAAARFITGRATFVLAIDQTSFGPALVPAARDAARRLMSRIGAEDALGLIAFPGTISIPPATNRQSISAAIEKIAGLAADAPTDERAARSVSGLDATVRALGAIPGRKTLVVVSAGIGMPKESAVVAALTEETAAFGRAAEAAGVTLNVLFLEWNDIRTYGPPLFSFARATGGTFYQMALGADRYVGNLVKDASAYYVLDVAPLETERDGKEHVLTVSLIDSRLATVRTRTALTIPVR